MEKIIKFQSELTCQAKNREYKFKSNELFVKIRQNGNRRRRVTVVVPIKEDFCQRENKNCKCRGLCSLQFDVLLSLFLFC